MKDVAIIITGYLSDEEFSCNSESRFKFTFDSIKSLREKSKGINIFLAFTGDKKKFLELINLLNWPLEYCAHFEQDAGSLKFGKGLLEHQLLINAIEKWHLEVGYKRIVKITAKYDVDNFLDVLNFLLKKQEKIFAWKYLFKRMVDTKLFIFCPQSYKENSFFLEKINDNENYYMEHAVFDLMEKFSIRHELFLNRPIYIGLSGSTGVFVRTSIAKRVLVKIYSGINNVFIK